MCWVLETTGNWDAHPADLIPEKALYGGAFGTLYRIAVSRWKEGPGGEHPDAGLRLHPQLATTTTRTPHHLLLAERCR
jgi:hypothetical protein